MHISDRFIRNVKSRILCYLCMYRNISCVCQNNTENHLICGQQLLGWTLRKILWLWNWALFCQIMNTICNLYKGSTGCFCTMVVSVQWLFLYHGHFCTMVVSVQWMFLFHGCFCTMVVSVQWMFLYHGCFCTMVVSVQWLFLYNGCFCTMVVSVQWLFLYDGCFCTMDVSVQWTFL